MTNCRRKVYFDKKVDLTLMKCVKSAYDNEPFLSLPKYADVKSVSKMNGNLLYGLQLLTTCSNSSKTNQRKII